MKEFIIRYWLQTLFTASLGLLGYLYSKLSTILKKEMSDQASIKAGVQAILRDRIIQSYNHHMESGFCAIHDRDNITNMYEQYHTLGANGVIDSLINELMDLPVKCRDGRKIGERTEEECLESERRK